MKYIIKSGKGITSLALLFITFALLSATIQSCDSPTSPIEQEQDQAITTFLKQIEMSQAEIRKVSDDLGTVPVESRTKLSVQKAEQALAPVHQASQDLLEAYGFTPEAFEGSGFTMDSPEVVYMALAIAGANVESGESFGSAFMNACTTSAYAQEVPSLDRTWGCLKRAAMIELPIEIYRNAELSSFAGRKRMIKTFGKLLSRYMGPIGVAITLADFSICMFAE